MLERIDNFLNSITMYRVMLYYLIFLLAGAIALSAASLLKYDPFAILFTVAFMLAICALSLIPDVKLLRLYRRYQGNAKHKQDQD